MVGNLLVSYKENPNFPLKFSEELFWRIWKIFYRGWEKLNKPKLSNRIFLFRESGYSLYLEDQENNDFRHEGSISSSYDGVSATQDLIRGSLHLSRFIVLHYFVFFDLWWNKSRYCILSRWRGWWSVRVVFKVLSHI